MWEESGEPASWIPDLSALEDEEPASWIPDLSALDEEEEDFETAFEEHKEAENEEQALAEILETTQEKQFETAYEQHKEEEEPLTEMLDNGPVVEKSWEPQVHENSDKITHTT